MIQIYGSFTGEHSLAQVSKGFASVFFEATCFDLFDYTSNDLDEVRKALNASAEHGIFVGSLDRLDHLYRAKHEKSWVMVAPNSNKIGRLLEKNLEHFPRLLAPSRWAQGVLQRIFPDKEVLFVPHGVSSEFYPVQLDRNPEERYSVLHMSSTVLERKGTMELLKAWRLADLPNATLFISVPGSIVGYHTEIAQDLGLTNVKITGRLDQRPQQMRSLYSFMDLVVQPSRGEGFGLVPCEARACGTPVLMTACTGHSEHANESGTMIIPTGDYAPMEDLPGSVAPSLSVKDLAQSLVSAHRSRHLLTMSARAGSEAFRSKWRWENQLKGFRNVIDQ